MGKIEHTYSLKILTNQDANMIHDGSESPSNGSFFASPTYSISFNVPILFPTTDNNLPTSAEDFYSTMMTSPNPLLESNESEFRNLTLPYEMSFNESHMIRIMAYTILMIVSAVCNLSLLVSLARRTSTTPVSRVNLMLQHLAVADLLVTFLLMPLEIGWAATVRWRAGDFMCRIMAFFRTFGVFLSGFLLVVISLDRYYAVLHPLTVTSARIRLRKLIFVAWISAGVCSFPQAIIFHVESHPAFPWFEQCVTFDAFPTPEYELAYNLAGTVAMYLGPLVAIIFCYGAIVIRLYRIDGQEPVVLGRSRTQTLLMTSVIVLVFFLCWTPYNVMSLWYFIDRSSAQTVDHRIQASLFIFAVANSTVNPLVYGFFRARRGNSGTGTRTSKTSRRIVYRAPFRQHLGRWNCTATHNSSSSDPNQHMQRYPKPNGTRMMGQLLDQEGTHLHRNNQFNHYTIAVPGQSLYNNNARIKSQGTYMNQFHLDIEYMDDNAPTLNEENRYETPYVIPMEQIKEF